MENNCALTTFDNPFDPFEQFSQWFLFDVEKGYNTCSLLGRLARTSDEFSEQENNAEIERTINEIVEHDYLGIYKKITRKTKEETKEETKED